MAEKSCADLIPRDPRGDPARVDERRRRSPHLPGVGRHPPGHHPLQVAAQAHALHSDDGLLGEDGAAEGERGGYWQPEHSSVSAVGAAHSTLSLTQPLRNDLFRWIIDDTGNDLWLKTLSTAHELLIYTLCINLKTQVICDVQKNLSHRTTVTQEVCFSYFNPFCTHLLPPKTTFGHDAIFFLPSS